MIKLLLTFLILAASSLGAKSQTTDTLCFPVPVIQKVLIAAKQKQVQDTLIALYRNDISILQQKTTALQETDSTNKEIIATYQAMTLTMKSQRALLETQIRKLKRRNTFTAIAGVVATSLTAFLFITK